MPLWQTLLVCVQTELCASPPLSCIQRVQVCCDVHHELQLFEPLQLSPLLLMKVFTSPKHAAKRFSTSPLEAIGLCYAAQDQYSPPHPLKNRIDSDLNLLP